MQNAQSSIGGRASRNACRRLPFAKDNRDLPLTAPRESKPFRGSRLEPAKADSMGDQKGKHHATCPVESDSPCISQGKRVPDAGSEDQKTTDPRDRWCDVKPAASNCRHGGCELAAQLH